MLKIKDNVELKELEKFGFKQIEDKSYKEEYDLGKIIGEFDNKQDAQDYYNELVGEERTQEIY